MTNKRVLFLVFWMFGAVTIDGALQAQTTTSVWSGVYSEEQAKRGDLLYAQQCGSCHGSTLEGGEMAPALAGGSFNSNWNDLTIADIVERVRTTMPASSPGSLSRPQSSDIVAFMLSIGGFPAGQVELPRELESLKQISFEASKP